MNSSVMTFTLAGIPVEAEYRNVKALRLTVYPPDGRVRISAPPGTTPEYIKKFAASKIAWIEKHREKFRGSPKVSGVPGNNSGVYIWGEARSLEIVKREGNARLAASGGTVKIFVRPLSPESKITEVLDKWYRRAVKEKAENLIGKWEGIIGVKINKLFVRKMKSHWGSCNYERQTIRLNSELAKLSPECLEYVIVHEMLHIIEKGHNRIFYGYLNKYIPNWKIIRKKMNSGGL